MEKGQRRKILYKADHPHVKGIFDLLGSNSTWDQSRFILQKFSETKYLIWNNREIRFFVNAWFFGNIPKLFETSYFWNKCSGSWEQWSWVIPSFFSVYGSETCVLVFREGWLQRKLSQSQASWQDPRVGIVVPLLIISLSQQSNCCSGFSERQWVFHDSLRWSE